MFEFRFIVLVTLAVAGWSAVPGSTVAAADSIQPTPPELEHVEVSEKLAADLPMDLAFKDETGAPIVLADLLAKQTTPVVLTFNYSDCPMLCSVQLGGLVDTLRQMEWTLGTEFRVITISLDPRESHRRAMETKLSYLERYDRGDVDAGWRFLTGDEASIRRLADSVGFGYRLHEGQYLHPAVLTLLSPGGVVSGYVYGVKYDPEELRTKLKVASMGGTSRAAQKFLLSCYHYEKPEGRAALAVEIMRYGGFVFAVGLALALGILGVRRSIQGGATHDAGSN